MQTYKPSYINELFWLNCIREFMISDYLNRGWTEKINEDIEAMLIVISALLLLYFYIGYFLIILGNETSSLIIQGEFMNGSLKIIS